MSGSKKGKGVRVTALGVSATAYPDALDDIALLNTLTDLGDDDARAVVHVGRALFGPKGWERLCEDLSKGGDRSITRVVSFVEAAKDQIKALKN